MALGGKDANGIWHYGEDDSRSTFSALLNVLAASVSAAIADLMTLINTNKTDIATNKANIATNKTNIATNTRNIGRLLDAPARADTKIKAASGWTLDYQKVYLSPTTVEIYIDATRTGPAIDSESIGNIANSDVAIISDATLHPHGYAPLSSGLTGKMCHGGVSGQDVRLSATVWGGGIRQGETISLGGMWTRRAVPAA